MKGGGLWYDSTMWSALGVEAGGRDLPFLRRHLAELRVGGRDVLLVELLLPLLFGTATEERNG